MNVTNLKLTLNRRQKFHCVNLLSPSESRVLQQSSSSLEYCQQCSFIRVESHREKMGMELSRVLTIYIRLFSPRIYISHLPKLY